MRSGLWQCSTSKAVQTMSEEKVLSGMRCAIYNRCSTTEEAQNRAIETQAAESVEIVQALGGVICCQYIEQESGTTTKKRTQYASLMADVQQERIDCIVIKSIDRLMRNAGDWHEFIQHITAHRVRLYLYLERKFYEPQDAFLSGIKALIAEQYSRELSQKVNNAHKRRQKKIDGKLTVNNNVYGYRKEKDGYRIEETEAVYIRRIYAMSAGGAGGRKIAKELYAMGMRNRKNGAVSDVTVRRLIQNPLYKGTAVMHKTHYDFELKKQCCLPKEQWIYHENRIPAIVSEKLWQAANDALNARKSKSQAKEQKERSPLPQYCLKIVCGKCGCAYCKRTGSAGNVYWMCGRQLEKNPDGTVCKNITVYEKELEPLLWEQFQKEDMESIKTQTENGLLLLEKVLKKNPCSKDFCMEYGRLREKKKNLLQKYMDGIVSDSDYKLASEMLAQQINQMTEQEKRNDTAKPGQRLFAIRQYLYSEEGQEAVRQAVVQNTLSEITVYPDNRLCVCYRTGACRMMPYRHIHAKMKKRQESIQKIEQLFLSQNRLTTAEIAEYTGYSQGNILQKLKELKQQGRIRYVSMGKNGGCWEDVSTGIHQDKQTKKTDGQI